MTEKKAVIKVCPLCKQTTTVIMPVYAYNKWITGAAIQEAWPLSFPVDREVLISGICPKYQEVVFDGL